MDVAFQNQVLPDLYKAADLISRAINSQYPPQELPNFPGLGAVPDDGVEALAWALTEVVAEVLQSYFNAGSESDSIHENLGPLMEAEVRDWSFTATTEAFYLKLMGGTSNGS